MTKATYVPTKTETKTVEVEPAAINITLTVEEAQSLDALIGKTSGRTLWKLYIDLGKVLDSSGIERKSLAFEGRGPNEDKFEGDL